MKKIQIQSLEELIKSNYPQQEIEKLLNNILILSLNVKNDYPDYKEWFLNTQVPGLYDNTRNIIVAHIDFKIVGFISLKKTQLEKKICTFYVEKSFQKNKIGTLLVEAAFEYLEDTKPLITMPIDHLKDFIKMSEKYNWEITDIKENLYRMNNPEIILNGVILEKEKEILIPKSLKKVYRIYKFQLLKNIFNFSSKLIISND